MTIPDLPAEDQASLPEHVLAARAEMLAWKARPHRERRAPKSIPTKEKP